MQTAVMHRKVEGAVGDLPSKSLSEARREVGIEAVSRQLQLLGKALGKEGLAEEILPDAMRMRQPDKAASEVGLDANPSAQREASQGSGGVPDRPRHARAAASISALDRLRQRGHQPHREQCCTEPPIDEGRHGPVPTSASTSPASSTPAPVAGGYKPWGRSVPQQEPPSAAPSVAQTPAQSGEHAAGAPKMSALQRLRMKASGLPPKRLERRDHDKWADPLVEGGARVPIDYPDEQAWPNHRLPPGSLHDEAAWWSARTGQPSEMYDALDEEARSGHESKFWVMEIAGSSGSLLMSIPKDDTQREGDCGMGALFGQTFDGTMLVMQDARPQFPGAAEPKRHTHGKFCFWVIRPREHYLEGFSMKSLFCNARWTSQVDCEEGDVAENPGDR